jgi:hypothetical protein
MGAQDPSIGMSCLDYHSPDLYRVCSVNVLSDWPRYCGVQSWKMDSEEVEGQVERLVEGLEILSARVVERVEIEIG